MLETIDAKTKLATALEQCPGLVDYLVQLAPEYRLLQNGTIRRLMAGRVDMEHVAERGGFTFEELHERLAEFDPASGERVGETDADDTKERLKAAIKQLSQDADVGAFREEFKDLLREADPLLIAVAEAELTSEGYTLQDLMNTCDLHLEVFEEALESARVDVPQDHPLWRLTFDHDAVLHWLKEARELAEELAAGTARPTEVVDKLRSVLAKADSASNNHDTRQENTLFPMLERYGVEEPPTIMWDEHYRMKQSRKRVFEVLDDINPKDPDRLQVDRLRGLLVRLYETFVQHTTKEQQILYPVALDLLSARDWARIEKDSDELGYFELPREVAHNV